MMIHPLARRDHRATLTASREGCIKSGAATGWRSVWPAAPGPSQESSGSSPAAAPRLLRELQVGPLREQPHSALDRGGALSDNVRRTHYRGHR
jgi:hypothetical protein